MGITVSPYTTDEGFVLDTMYLSIESFRLVKTLSNDVFGCVFTVAAYKSRDALHAGVSPIKIPQHLANCEAFVRPTDFYTTTIYGIAYQRVKDVWFSHGFQIRDVQEPNQPSPTSFVYDSQGIQLRGF